MSLLSKWYHEDLKQREKQQRGYFYGDYWGIIILIYLTIHSTGLYIICTEDLNDSDEELIKKTKVTRKMTSKQ